MSDGEHPFQIPEQPAALCGWLEDLLTSGKLSELVYRFPDEIWGQAGSRPTLEEWLGADRHAVLEKGLAAVGIERLRELVREPELLCELEDLVITEGGEYWNKLIEQRCSVSASELNALVKSALESETSPSAAPLAGYPSIWSRVFAGLQNLAVVAMVLVISTMAGRALWDARTVSFAKLSRSTQSRDAFFAQFQEVVRQFKDQLETGPDRDELERILLDYRDDCETLAQTGNASLSPADREWVIVQCTSWSALLTEQLASLRGGADVSTTLAKSLTISEQMLQQTEGHARNPQAIHQGWRGRGRLFTPSSAAGIATNNASRNNA